MLIRTTRLATAEEVATLNRRGRSFRPDWFFIGCSLSAAGLAAMMTAVVVALVVWFGGAANPRTSFLGTFWEVTLWCMAVLGGTVAVVNVGNQLSRMVGWRPSRPPRVEELRATATRAALAPGVLDDQLDLMFLLVEPDRVLAIAVGDELPERAAASVGSEFVRVRLESGAVVSHELSGASIPVTAIEVPEDAQVLLLGVVDQDVRLADLPECIRAALGGG